MTEDTSVINPGLDKAALRALAFERRRAAFNAHGAAAGTAIADRAIKFLGSRGGVINAVAAFISIRDEIDTQPLLSAIRANGFAIALPVIRPGPRLIFRRWTQETPLLRRKFGLLEPGDACAEITPDAVFVPLLAFDAAGNRLGYGAGYYDAGLSALRASQPALVAAGIAFDEQEMPAIPHESHDERLNAVITPSRTILCGS